jgi:hypothetical protein
MTEADPAACTFARAPGAMSRGLAWGAGFKVSKFQGF